MRAVVTGANRGIGLELTRQLIARGDTVHAGARDPKSAVELQALVAGAGGRLHVESCDIASQSSVGDLVKRIGDEPLDLLINNAGVRGGEDSLGHIDYAHALTTFDVNALGTIRITEALLPALRKARGKVAHISSGLASIHDNRSGGGYAYRMSKVALNMATRSLAIDLRRDGVVVLTLNPGWVKTDMGGANAPVKVEDSVSGLLTVIGRATMEDSGSFLDFAGGRVAW